MIGGGFWLACWLLDCLRFFLGGGGSGLDIIGGLNSPIPILQTNQSINITSFDRSKLWMKLLNLYLQLWFHEPLSKKCQTQICVLKNIPSLMFFFVEFPPPPLPKLELYFYLLYNRSDIIHCSCYNRNK